MRLVLGALLLPTVVGAADASKGQPTYELRCAPSIAEGLGYWAYALPARGGNRGDGHYSGRPLRSHSFRDMIDLRGT